MEAEAETGERQRVLEKNEGQRDTEFTAKVHGFFSNTWVPGWHCGICCLELTVWCPLTPH